MNAGQPSIVEMFAPFLVIIVIFYFFGIRPQSKKLKEHDSFLTQLKRGDQVYTASGILGTVDGMTDLFVSLEIDSGTKIKILKKQIAGLQAALNPANNKSETKK
jgi:preprotein translocase subunit YajC